MAVAHRHVAVALTDTDGDSRQELAHHPRIPRQANHVGNLGKLRDIENVLPKIAERFHKAGLIPTVLG
jgi:hypothetical protein